MADPRSPALLVPIESAPGLQWSPPAPNGHNAHTPARARERERERGGYFADAPQLRKERRKRNRRILGGGYHQHQHQHQHYHYSPSTPTPNTHHPAADGDDEEEDPDSDGDASFDDPEPLYVDPDEEEQDGAGGAGEHLALSRGELAGLVLAHALSPLPLLAPYACAQLSPGLFVPLLALAGLLAWLQATVVGVEGRYVGARSYPALASGVLPHRLKLYKLGEFLASLFVLAGAVVRTTLGLVASAEILVDVLVPERRRRDWERAVAVGVLGAVWLLVPLLWSSILALLGFNAPAGGRTSRNSIQYTRLSTRSSTDLEATPQPPVAAAGAGTSATWERPVPRHSRPESRGRPRARWSALLKLPAWSVAVVVWPLALLILGVRLKRLNRDSMPSLLLSSLHTLPLLSASASANASDSLSTAAAAAKLPLILRPDDARHKLAETQLWPAILLTFFLLQGATHETFYYVTALRRPEIFGGGGGGRARRRGAGGGGGEGGGLGGREGDEEAQEGAYVTGFEDGACTLDRDDGADEVSPTASRSPVRTKGGGLWTRARREAQRNQFPLAVGGGLLGAFGVQLGWALVGTQGLAATLPPTIAAGTWSEGEEPPPAAPPAPPIPIPTGNLLSDPRLPRADPFLLLVRALVLFATLTQLEAHAHVGLARARRLLSFFRPVRPRAGAASPSGRDSPVNLAARRVAARILFYGVVVLSGWATVAVPMWHRERHGGRRDVGGHGTGLVGLAEWSGVGIAGVGGCIAPALAYLILFHLRRPRFILLSDPTSPQFSNDDLLQRKEREMQRRLSGRRIGTDLGVFGLLGPVGVVLVVRGAVAMVRRSVGS